MTKPSGGRLFDALASLRLAVVVMIALAGSCLAATLYESKHGTPAAQREFYRTAWFSGILVMLGVNIFCAMMKRYPWKKHHTGFVLAHIGILTLLVGSLFSLHFGLDSNMALYEGETSDRVALQDKALHVSLARPAARGTWLVDFESRPPRPGREQRFALKGGDVLVAEDYLPHSKVREEFVEGASGPPALHFLLDNPFAKQDAWLVASDPERGHISFGPASVRFQLAASAAEVRKALHPESGQNEVVFVLDSDGVLHYGITTKTGPGADGVAALGKPFETPWMGMKVVAESLVPRAVPRRSIEADTPPEKEERRIPAVKVHLEGSAGRSPSEWLLWTEARSVDFGTRNAHVAYRAPELAVPFRVTLLKFNSDKYPGSNMAATYESWVRVDDPEKGSSEHHISMNHPLHYRGYIFFQASFVEGEPMMSIFSVARAPGLPLVYIGVILISAGVAWMFYLKPYLARRQAARALAAHRQRESRHEAQPTDPVSARPGAAPAHPAPGGV
jgi:hypothetical protein